MNCYLLSWHPVIDDKLVGGKKIPETISTLIKQLSIGAPPLA